MTEKPKLWEQRDVINGPLVVTLQYQPVLGWVTVSKRPLGLQDLRGIAPYCTGSLNSEEWVRKLRDEEW